MKKKYLKDNAFLQEFQELQVKEQFVKITLLDWLENPLQEIQGYVQSGSLNISGDSIVRRNGNITMISDISQNDLTNTNNLISINKKMKLEIGFTNTTNKYTEEEKIWFPLGIFVITASTVTLSKENATITVTFKDKMCLLNGECGGVFSASVLLNEIDMLNENGEYHINKPTLHQIIMELVNHFGGEQLGKILISDLDTRTKQVMKWIGNTPLYRYKKTITDSYHYTANEKKAKTDTALWEAYEYGHDVGYVYTDFTYPGELVAQPGENICTILSKITSLLGNFEYFYDIDGNFRFQEIKNYLNNSQSTVTIKSITGDNPKFTQDDYTVDFTKGKEMYDLSNSKLILSFQNSPKFENIKNDYVVWGIRKNPTNNQSFPCRYHLAIDKKPSVGNTYKVFFVVDPEDNLKKAKVPIEFEHYADLPEVGVADLYYHVQDTDKVYNWRYGYIEFTKEIPETATVEEVKKFSDLPARGLSNVYYKVTSTNKVYLWLLGYQIVNVELKSITTTDWRTELYLQGVMAERVGGYSNDYYAELKNEWPKIYDVEGGKFRDDIEETGLDYYLDFIDTDSKVANLSVQNIGRRTIAKNDTSVNCVFEEEIPDILLLKIGSETLEDDREECIRKGQEYAQIKEEIYDLLAVGGTYNSAFWAVRDMLYQYTSYSESLNMAVLPIYNIEPNNRIKIENVVAGVAGEYLIKTVSIPLSISGTMNLSCVRLIEKI